MIFSKLAREALAGAVSVMAGSALAQATPPDAQVVSPPSLRAPRLEANDSSCRPVYPEGAHSLQREEESHLILHFAADGKFMSVQMLRGTDATAQQRQLDFAAARALSNCPFYPGQDVDGRPVGGQIELTYRWVLEPPREARETRILTKRPDCGPTYPMAALRAGAQGVTRLAFHLDETGKVLRTEIVQSAGNSREHHLLDAAAAAGLATCPFQPIRDEGGKPIPGTVTLSFTWRLE